MASRMEDRSFALVVVSKETEMQKALKPKLTWISKQDIQKQQRANAKSKWTSNNSATKGGGRKEELENSYFLVANAM